MKLTKLFIVFIITFFSFTIVNGQNVIERPNPPVLVTDLAGVLSPEQKQALENKLVAIDDASSNQIAVVNEREALEIDILVPSMVKEGQDGVRFIDKDNQRLNHTNMSNAEYKEMVENEARGFEVRDPTKLDSFLERIDRALKKKRKNDDNKKEEKARSKKVKLTSVQRKSMMFRFTSSTTKMRFTHERFDEKGIVDATFGPNSNRRKNAGHVCE